MRKERVELGRAQNIGVPKELQEEFEEVSQMVQLLVRLRGGRGGRRAIEDELLEDLMKERLG
jgi:hypothetical protein